MNKELNDLIQIIKTLRSPQGCPWDQSQKQEDIASYLLEEAYEVVDALYKKDPKSLRGELGDLIFQILFICEMNAERGFFSLKDVLDEIKEKMIRRHPHVFENPEVKSVEEIKENWHRIKKQEKKQSEDVTHVFHDLPLSFPALKRAQKITSLASSYGFDWKDSGEVLEKLREEFSELQEAVEAKSREAVQNELGDILFTVVNVCRFFSVDAECALFAATEKFLQRVFYVTRELLSRGLSWEEASPEQLDALWLESKTKDRR